MSNPGRYPTRLAPLVFAMRESGPMSREDLIAREPRAIRNGALCDWTSKGWLTERPDGLYEPGPKSADLQPYDPPPPKAVPDRTAVEGSNHWLIVHQLAHERLCEGDLADLLDVPIWKALEELRGLARLGYVRRVQRGGWELVKRMENAG